MTQNAAYKIGETFDKFFSGDNLKFGTGMKRAAAPGKENDERAAKGARGSPSRDGKGGGRGIDFLPTVEPLGPNGASQPSEDHLVRQISALLDAKLDSIQTQVNLVGEDLSALREETGKEFKRFVTFVNGHSERISAVEAECTTLKGKKLHISGLRSAVGGSRC